MAGMLAALVPAIVLLAATARRRARWPFPWARSSPAAPSSRSSPATPSSTHTSVSSRAERVQRSPDPRRGGDRARRRLRSGTRRRGPVRGPEPPPEHNGRELNGPPGGFRRRATDRDPDEPDDLERARQLAEIHGLPLVDLAVTGVSPEATKMVPLAVLERVGAIPYYVDDDTAADRAHRPGQRPRHRRAPPDLEAAGRVRGRAARGRDGRGEAAHAAPTSRSARSSTTTPTRRSRTSPTTSRPRTASRRGRSSGS